VCRYRNSVCDYRNMPKICGCRHRMCGWARPNESGPTQRSWSSWKRDHRRNTRRWCYSRWCLLRSSTP
jgi:hypothetical protein